MQHHDVIYYLSPLFWIFFLVIKKQNQQQQQQKLNKVSQSRQKYHLTITKCFFIFPTLKYFFVCSGNKCLFIRAQDTLLCVLCFLRRYMKWVKNQFLHFHITLQPVFIINHVSSFSTGYYSLLPLLKQNDFLSVEQTLNQN